MTPGLHRLILGNAVLLLLASCAPPLSRTIPIRLSPMQAVMNAAEMPGGVSGVFEMVVRASGRQDGMLYLNSELDYRDPRNLSIDLAPAVERALEQRIGPVQSGLAGKTIAVRGTAKTVRIYFFANGYRTDKYYYQTHLVLASAQDLTVTGERAPD